MSPTSTAPAGSTGSAAVSRIEWDGREALPRSNGELVFAEPWESRAFGMTATLVDSATFSWDEFRVHLVASIDGWQAVEAGETWNYYRCWLAALESVLVERSVLDSDDVSTRADELAARPPGYDHGHDHGQDHGHDH